MASLLVNLHWLPACWHIDKCVLWSDLYCLLGSSSVPFSELMTESKLLCSLQAAGLQVGSVCHFSLKWAWCPKTAKLALFFFSIYILHMKLSEKNIVYRNTSFLHPDADITNTCRKYPNSKRERIWVRFLPSLDIFLFWMTVPRTLVILARRWLGDSENCSAKKSLSRS